MEIDEIIRIDNISLTKKSTILDIRRHLDTTLKRYNNIVTKISTKKSVSVIGGNYFVDFWFCKDVLTKIILYPDIETNRGVEQNKFSEALRYKYNYDNLTNTYGKPYYKDLYEIRYKFNDFTIKTNITNQGNTNNAYFYKQGLIEINF